MKTRREMTAMEHIALLVREGYIKVSGKTIVIQEWARDDDGELPQVVIDYMSYAARHGYEIVW